MKKPIDWQAEERREQVRVWASEAGKRLPSPANWGFFVAGMKVASASFDKLPEGSAEQRMLIIDMIGHVFALLCREPAFDQTIKGGLMPLIEALFDVERDIPASLFKVNPRKGKPPLNVVRERIKGAAARALLELISVNPEMNAAQRKLDADKVARAIKTGKCFGHEKVTGKTVINWLSDLRLGPEAGGKRNTALDRFVSTLPSEAGATHQSRADFILGSLRSGIGFK